MALIVLGVLKNPSPRSWVIIANAPGDAEPRGVFRAGFAECPAFGSLAAGSALADAFRRLVRFV